MSSAVKDSMHQRGLRLSKPHAQELVNLYSGHAQAENFRGEDLLKINEAHVIMLQEQGLLNSDEARRILAVIRKLQNKGWEKAIHLDPSIGDLSTHVEAYIIKETGEGVGGKIHTGRSRNDIYLTLARMLVRRFILDVYGALTGLEKRLLTLAKEHIETVMPGYTHHSQPAQPITLGHYFVGNFDVFARDLRRIEDFWPRVNTCPMGAAALATTGFPLNRQRMAELLGFDGIHEHSYDAVSSRDFLLEYLFILAQVASDLGRISENILLWATFEFGMITLADEYTSFSSIMPQKKNPVAVESIRALNSVISGKLSNALGILKAEPWSNGRETIILDDDSVDSGRQVRDMIILLDGILRTMQVRKDRMAELASEGYCTATELADTLVRECDLPFRTAHEIVGMVVKRAIDSGLGPLEVTPELVNQCARKYFGKDLPIRPESIRRALDPRENVRVRNLPGGPSFEETARMIVARKKAMTRQAKFLVHRQNRIAQAEAKRNELGILV
ncbi:MAG: argininosuccinate lyase [Deltaproteobacteria bacterium]|nr:argininosuccinate lyase [Deltaproteobacteria bacterium]